MSDADSATITVSGDRSGLAALRAFVSSCGRTAGLSDDALDDLANILDELWSVAVGSGDEVTAEIGWDSAAVTLAMTVDEAAWLQEPEDRIALVASLTPSDESLDFVDGKARVLFPVPAER